ncbi:hypothetical protein ACP70R_033674 [Stipagrostis hirtigluma subsp. patula]
MDDQDKAKPRRRAFGDITNTLQSETPKEVCNKDNLEPNANADWLRRNDHYTVRRFSGRVDMSGTNNLEMPLISSGDGSIIDLTKPSEKDGGEIMND